MRIASDLGSVLGSERACDLKFDHNAVAAWIDSNVDGTDMGFAGSLSMMTQGAEYQAQMLDGASKVAHCRAIEKTARHFGFIK
jgi:hypothetical protein